MITVVRPVRYLSTYWWLLKQHVSLHPWRFLLAIGSGVAFRFSNIMALIISMKCALWILDPNRQPHSFAVLFKNSPFAGVEFVFMPLVLVVIAVAAERAHLRLSAKVRLDIAERMAITDVRGNLSPQAIGALSADRAQQLSHLVAEKYERSHHKIYRAQGWFIQIIIAVAVLALIFSVGFYIEFEAMLIVLLTSIPLLVAFVWRRHAHSRQNFEEQEIVNADVRRGKLDFQSRLRRWVQKPGAGNWKAIVSQYAGLLNSSIRLGEHFQTTSELILNLGQGVVFTLFLLYLFLSGPHGDPSRLGAIAICIVLIRYCIAQLRIIAIAAIQMSRDYPLLVRLSQRA